MAACKQNHDEVSGRPAKSLYVHVPFCRGKCRYCDFYSRPLEPALGQAYLGALRAELDMHRAELCLPLATVYVGGGTPTALDRESLGQLLAMLRPLLARGGEFSIEANPCTIDPAMAAELIDGGANRVTLGVQSFDDGELKRLGRLHDSHQAIEAAGLLRRAGLKNLGMDLIYGVPGGTLDSWRRSLQEALRLRPEHLSCYGLSFEEHTPLHQDLQQGRVTPMEDAEQKECYQAAIDACVGAGMEHYEISNFAMPSRRCRHNMTYWRNETYLGLGPAAASFLSGVRRTNVPDLAMYLAAMSAHQAAPAVSEELPPRPAMAETMMLGLRLMEGVDRDRFERRFGVDPLAAFPRSLGRHAQIGAVEITDRHIRIGRSWLFVSDTILADILAEA